MFPDEAPRDIAYRALDLRAAAANYMEAHLDRYGPILLSVADTFRLPTIPEGADAATWALGQLRRPDIHAGVEVLQAISAIILRPIRVLREEERDFLYAAPGVVPRLVPNRQAPPVVIAALLAMVNVHNEEVVVDHFAAVTAEWPRVYDVQAEAPPPLPPDQEADAAASVGSLTDPPPFP